MRKLIILSVFVLTLSGCSATSNSANKPGQVKVEDTTLVGTLSAQESDKAILQSPTGPVSVESYSVDFTGYSGKKVSVTGQYSGDTLFVDEISEVK